jgi:hypothetical protein
MFNRTRKKSIYVLRYEVRSEGRSKTKLHPSLCTPPRPCQLIWRKASMAYQSHSKEGTGAELRDLEQVRRADRRSEGRCLWWAHDQVADINSSLGWGERWRQEWWLGWRDLG